ncbi:MAG: hypothetical protein ACREL7_04475 [Longimicrobiales bacterium]
MDDLVDDPRALRDTHFDGLLHTIAMHNRIAAEAATVRTRRQMPRTSSLGVSLSLDYDLKVRTRRDRTWWALPPSPGTLSAGGRSESSDNAL